MAGSIEKYKRHILISGTLFDEFMKIEQNLLTYAESADPTGTNSTVGYIDLARNLSAVNGKSITQTKRRDGKYKPLAYLVKVRALKGNVILETLNCGYPTRNAVVLAGAARDAMLKSAGVSRSNLESYQKELRLLMDVGMAADKSNTYFPGATAVGASSGGWGDSLTYDYTKLQLDDPDGVGAPMSKYLRMLGAQSAGTAWDDDQGFFVIDNWRRFRHSFTPSANADDTENNVFSWAMQQSDTAGAIIDNLEDEADEKPYNLYEFGTHTMYTTVGTTIGNPSSTVITVPLGLMKITTVDPSVWEIEVVGVTEL